MKVLKFGGSSLANSAGFRNVANIVMAETTRSIITVSATATTTDQLHQFVETSKSEGALSILDSIIKKHSVIISQLDLEQNPGLSDKLDSLQQQLINNWQRLRVIESDNVKAAQHLIAEILSVGEYLSSYILHALLRQLGGESSWLDSKLYIIANGHILESKVDLLASQQAWNKQGIDSNSQYTVAPGFISSDSSGNACLLGRNGSDCSAAIFAYLSNASTCEIWTDVSGIFNADPKVISEAHIISRLSYKEAMEFAHHGACVIHPKAIGPLQSKQIPLMVKNSFEPRAAGTIIEPSALNDKKVKGISCQRSMSLINISGAYLCDTYGAAERIFGVLARQQISVILISQSSSEYSVCFAIRSKDQEKALLALNQELKAENESKQLNPIEVKPNRAIVTIVGQGLIKQQGISSKFLSAISLSNINIEAIAQGSSELSISAVIEERSAAQAYRRVYAEFFNRKRQIDLFILGCGNVGSELIRQVQSQKPYLSNKDISVDVRLIANSRHYYEGAELNQQEWLPLVEQSQQVLSNDTLQNLINSGNYINPTIVDCTCSEEVSANYHQYLNMGFNLVTANKKANSRELSYYRHIRQIARRRFRHFFYETNVGAGLPILKTLDSLLCSGDKVEEISGILSGSLSYILGLMEDGVPFSQAVAQAKELGFTEPDPRDDLSGIDVARKILILARELGAELELSDIQLDSLLPDDFDDQGSVDDFMQSTLSLDKHFSQLFDNAKAHNATLKYVATFQMNEQGGSLKVGLEQVSADHPLYSIKGGENAIAVYSEYYSPIPFVIKGYGAGASVTASGIFSDILQTLPHREQEMAS